MSTAERIPVSRPELGARERDNVLDCVDSGWVSSIGKFVETFEERFAAVAGQTHGVSVNSGTAALHLALRALGVGPGDEVVVPALTFAATANAVLYQGATPVFADSDPETWNLDVGGLEELLGPRVRAIIPVHLYGRPCDMGAIGAIAGAHGVPIVEDAAEAHGASIDGRPVGGFGIVGCFSFYGNKMITTGEGGVCVTSDADLDRRMRVLRDHGMTKRRRYWHDEVGYNYRMTNLQAALGCAQLERLAEFVERRRAIRDRYAERLDGLGCVLPRDDPPAHNVFWLFTLLLPPHLAGEGRDALIAHLDANGVDSRPVFPILPQMPPYRAFSRPVPVAADLAARGISLPTFHALTDAQIDRVCDLVRGWLGGGGR